MPFIDLNLSFNRDQDQIEQIIEQGRLSEMDIKQIISTEISEWESSEQLKWMIRGAKYYRNEPDIIERERKVVGESGALETVRNLANNKLINAFTRKLVNQKVGYLLSKPMNVRTKNDAYLQELEPYFDKRFMRLIQSLGTEAINKGIAWLHVYYDDQGIMRFMIIPSEQCIPIWKDAAHTELQAMIRYYQVEVYEGKERKTYTKVEWWDTNGVFRYAQQGADLIPDVELGEQSPHVVINDGEQGFNWERVPFIAFKYNDDELPLIKFIKSLVDDYDKQKSDVANNLEDLPNSIYVVKNYNGTEPDQFRSNVARYRVVFVSDDGDMKSVSIPIETEAVKQHLEQNRKDIYEFGRGVDTQSEKLGNASGVALKFLYADLDMDCNIIENQFQAALEQLLWFIDTDIANRTGADYFDEDVDFVFNRDIIINETEVIENAMKSKGVVSDETNIANHPWVDNVRAEIEQIESEQEKRLNEFESFNMPSDPRGTEDDE